MKSEVAVVDAYGQAMHDVIARAEAAYENSTATYRRLVAAMADSGGTLPPDQSDELVAACQSLGIPPERLADDAATIASVKRLTAQIEEVQQRNTARLAPLPGLQAAHETAQAEWLRVSGECQQRMKAAQADAAEKRKAYETLLNSRNESHERHDRDLLQIRDLNPHLFGPVSRDKLKHAITPRSRHIR
jgi:hypothetical protein